MRVSTPVYTFLYSTLTGLCDTIFYPGSISDTRMLLITSLYFGIFSNIVLRCLLMEINRPGGLSSAPIDLALKI